MLSSGFCGRNQRRGETMQADRLQMTDSNLVEISNGLMEAIAVYHERGEPESLIEACDKVLALDEARISWQDDDGKFPNKDTVEWMIGQRLDAGTYAAAAAIRAWLHTARPRRNANFLVSHWQGDLSLGVAFWVMGALLTVVFLGVLVVAGQFAESNFANGALILTLFAFSYPLFTWQVVGIWRSATKHRYRMHSGHTFWAGAAKTMVLLGVVCAASGFDLLGLPGMIEGSKLVLGIDDIPVHNLRVFRDGTALELSGGMPFGTAKAIQKLSTVTYENACCNNVFPQPSSTGHFTQVRIRCGIRQKRSC
jgi:hypothetical protein